LFFFIAEGNPNRPTILPLHRVGTHLELVDLSSLKMVKLVKLVLGWFCMMQFGWFFLLHVDR
jgi:hypothetical protein